MRATPNVRQARLLDMPSSGAAQMAESFSAEMTHGHQPRIAAARSPAATRLRIDARSHCARAPTAEAGSPPCGKGPRVVPPSTAFALPGPSHVGS